MNGVESIVARSLTDPAFLEALITAPDKTLDLCCLDPSIKSEFLSADLGKLRSFSGFITKVQHNYLWESLPATRKLLAFFGMEIELFAAYRKILLSQRTKNEERRISILRFIDFLEKYTKRKRAAPQMVHQVLRHERASWEARLAVLNSSGPSQTREPAKKVISWRELRQLRPMMNGYLAIREFSWDPIMMAAAILEERFDGKRPRRRPVILGYWGDCSSSQMRILRLEKIEAGVLCWVDGRRSVRQIVDKVRCGFPAGLLPRDFRGLFEGMTEAGIIRLSAPGF
jgi:hypothetical protein